MMKPETDRMGGAPVALQPRGALDDELARAELYGLLAQLWLEPPAAELLGRFAVAVTESPQTGGHLEAPWQALVAAMRTATPEAAAEEFENLFVGIGRPEVLPYASEHLAGALHEQPLAEVRADLAALGLVRAEGRLETEDHVAHGFEVMRYLIAGDDAEVCNLTQQQRFFRRHLQPWVEGLCDQVEAHAQARLWRPVAALTRAFMQVEAQAFDVMEAA